MRSIGVVGIGVALALAVAGGAWAAAANGDQAQAVPMSVRNVGMLDGQDVVLLEGGTPPVLLPIWIGPSEAAAIHLRLQNLKPPRPLSADLFETTVATLGARIERVEVIDLRDNVFIGRLTLRDARGAVHLLDARPSDLIALALGAHLPVFVAPRVLAQAALDPARLAH